MKHDTTRKPKFLRLKRRLGWPSWQVVGLLESMWSFVAEHHDLGAFKDPDDLACVIEFEGDIGPVIDALVAEKWLLPHEQHGYVVNDWNKHCSDFIKKRVARRNQLFLLETPDLWGKTTNNGRRCPDGVQSVADNGSQCPPMSALPVPVPIPIPKEKSTPKSEHLGADTDELDEFPELGKAYFGIWTAITKAHPHIKRPKPGSKADQGARLALARLARLDGFSEEDILAALRWALCCDSERASFWRGQVKGLQGLRHKAKNGDLKFGNLMTVFLEEEKAEAGGGHW